MKYDALSRRMFLQGASGSLLSVPFLSSLVPKSALAQTTTPVKRFISIITGYDMGHNKAWLPNDNSPVNNIGQPSRVLAGVNGHHAIRYQPLRDYAPTNSSALNIVTSNLLSPYLESVNVMRSLNHPFRYGHGGAPPLGGIIGPATFTNFRGNLPIIETADVVLNKNRRFNPAGLPLVCCGIAGFGEGGQDPYSYTAVAGAAGPTTNIGLDLAAVYNRLFSNGTLPENGGTNGTHARYNILSRVLEDYTRVRNSRHISASDRVTLDNALDQFSDTQQSLTRVATAQCSHRSLTRTGGILDVATNPAVGRAFADLIVASIMCDSARVFTIGAPMLGSVDVEGQSWQHEQISHQPFQMYGSKPSWQITAERQTVAVRNFVAPLVQRLSAAIDPSNGRSYLYNSLVYFTAESGQSHGWASHPVTLIGNAGGALTSGNYIDYANRAKGLVRAGSDESPVGGADGFSTTAGSPNFSSNWNGVAFNRLMVTILQAMGLTPADYEINSLNAQLYNRTDLGVNNNLNNVGGFGYVLPADIAGADTSNWGFDNFRYGLEGSDVRQFRYPLPMPA